MNETPAQRRCDEREKNKKRKKEMVGWPNFFVIKGETLHKVPCLLWLRQQQQQ